MERRRLWPLYAITVLQTLLMGMAFPLVPQFLKEGFQADPLTVGIVTGTYGLLQIIGRLPLGNVSDHLGRRNSLTAAFALTFLGGWFFVYAPNPWWIIPGEALFGLASGTFWVSANSYAAEAVPPDEVGTAMSRYAIAIDVGFLVGAPLGGVADILGFRTALTIFLWAGLLGILGALLLDETPRGELLPARQLYARAWDLLHVPDITVSAAGTFAYALLFGVTSAFLPYLLRDLGFTALVIGVVFSLRSAASIVSRLPLPRLMDRHGPRPILYGGTALAALAMAAIPLAPHAATLLNLPTLTTHIGTFPIVLPPSTLPFTLLGILIGLGIGIVIPANLTLVGTAAPDDARGLANGIYGTALGLGTTVSPLLFGAIADTLGLPWAFWGAAATTLTLVAFLPTLYRRLDPDHTPLAPPTPD